MHGKVKLQQKSADTEPEKASVFFTKRQISVQTTENYIHNDKSKFLKFNDKFKLGNHYIELADDPRPYHNLKMSYIYLVISSK